MLSRLRALSIVVLLGCLTACSGGKTPAAAPSPTPTPVATTTTPSLAPTATATVTAAPTPTKATRRKPGLDGDVDGDGSEDSIRATGRQLSVELSGNSTTITAPVHAEGPDATLLGSKDVDGDGFAEIFLQTAEGASTTFATPYRFDGTRLHELQLDGGPARLGIGGSVLHGDGFRCLPSGHLEVRSADSQDGVHFTVHIDVYRLGRAELVLLSSTSSQAKQGDPAVEQSYQVSCGSVGDGG